MKLIEKNDVIERSQDFNEGTCRIAASAKAFDILSSKIYTDVPRAIVRELSTNAYDAHVSIGKADKPFHVHLPNAFEPYFSIRDFGPGLSQEEVREIYTVYFSSTRNTSNEFAGCLGLGSKSPFAYTNSFIVTSYQNGKAASYSLFKNESGVPSYALIAETPSEDEPSGIEIKINVHSHDRSAFIKAASKVYHYFKVKPIISGDTLPTSEYKPTIEGSNYTIYEKDYNGQSNLYVLMGQVLYAVPQISISDYGFNPYYCFIEIHANIGDCSVAASREELHMDEATTKFIKNAILAIKSDAQSRIKSQLDQCQTKLQKALLLHSYNKTGLPKVADIRLEKTLVGKYDIYEVSKRSNQTPASVYNELPSLYDMADKGYVIIENDSENFSNRFRARLTKYCEDNPSKVKMLARIKDHNAFKDDFGEPHVKLSKLPDPPKAINTSNLNTERNYVWRLTRHGGGWDKNNIIIETTKNVAMVIRDGYYVIYDNKKLNVADLDSVMAFADIEAVYGVSPRYAKKLGKELPELFDLALKKLQGIIKGMSNYGWSYISHNNHYHKPEYFFELAKTNKYFADYCKAANAGDIPGIHNLVRMSQMLGVDISDKISSAENFYQILIEKYPLVEYVNGHEIRETVKEMKIYINAKGDK